MSIIAVLIVILAISSTRICKDKDTYLNTKSVLPLAGVLVIFLFCNQFVDENGFSQLSIIDKPLFFLTTKMRFLVMSPFMFYAGFKMFESFKDKKIFRSHLIKKQTLKVFLSFFVSWIIYSSISLYFKNDRPIPDYLLSLFGFRTISGCEWLLTIVISLFFISYFAFALSAGNIKRAMAIHILLTPILYFFVFKMFGGQWLHLTLVCYLFGVIFSFFKEKIDSYLEKRKTNGVILLIFSVVLFACFYFINYYSSNFFACHVSFLLANLFYCLSFTCLLFYFRIKSRILTIIGSNCLWIFMLHKIPLAFLNQSGILANNTSVFIALCFIVVLIMSFILRKAFIYVWNVVFLQKGNVGEETNAKIGIVISYVSLAFSILGAFIVTPRLLGMLGDVQYGLQSFATSMATWLTITSSALSASYLRFINQSTKRGGIGEAKMNSIYLKIFLLIAAVILAVVIITTSSCFLFKVSFGNYSADENKTIVTLLLISGINLSIQIATSVFNHYLIYKKEFIFLRGIALLVTFLTFLLELIFVYLTKSVISISVIVLVLTILSSITTVLFAIKFKKMKIDNKQKFGEKSILKPIIVFSSFVLLNSIVDQINQQVDITILGFMTNAENVTTYTLSRYFIGYMTLLSVSISGTYAPKVHEYVKNNDKVGLNCLFEKVSKIQLAVLLLVVGGFISCGRDFVIIWLGESKGYIYYYSLALLVLNIIPLSCNLGIEAQRAMNKHKFRAVLYISLALINVGLSILLICFLPTNMAVWAAIIGTIFSVLIGNIVILNFYNHFSIGLDMKKYLLNTVRYFAITSFAIAPSIVLYYYPINALSHGMSFVVNGAIFVVIYSAELLIIERKTVIPWIKKWFNTIKENQYHNYD